MCLTVRCEIDLSGNKSDPLLTHIMGIKSKYNDWWNKFNTLIFPTSNIYVWQLREWEIRPVFLFLLPPSPVHKISHLFRFVLNKCCSTDRVGSGHDEICQSTHVHDFVSYSPPPLPPYISMSSDIIIILSSYFIPHRDSSSKLLSYHRDYEFLASPHLVNSSKKQYCSPLHCVASRRIASRCYTI